MVETIDRHEDGFEIEGEFFRWAVTDQGKDLLLIDRFTKMPVAEFFELIEDSFDRGRAPIVLALIATSIRGGHPDWSIERIVRLVENTPLSEIAFIDSDAEAQQVPPAEGGPEPPTSDEPSNGSSPSSTPTDSSPPPTLSVIPPSSGSPGSDIGSPEPAALNE
jgi:hypothetical protein